MTVLKRLLSISLVMLIFSFILVGCKANNPEIKTEITLSNITEGDFQKFFNSLPPEAATKDDLKKLNVIVQITNSSKAEEKTVDIPSLSINLDRMNQFRISKGGSREQNIIGTEDTREFSQYIIFDMRGLSVQDIKNLYSKTDVAIRYKLKSGKLVERKVSIGENLIDNTKN